MESFKRWLLLQEIHHISLHGELVPFEVEGKDVIAIDMKFELRYRLLTKGKLNKALAIEISCACSALVISILLSTNIRLATNFITSGFGVLSA